MAFLKYKTQGCWFIGCPNKVVGTIKHPLMDMRIKVCRKCVEMCKAMKSRMAASKRRQTLAARKKGE